MSSHTKSPSPSGGVKGLVGKFEIRQETTSSRGPSPIPRSRLSSNSSSVHNMAPVRSSFVAVDPSRPKQSDCESSAPGETAESTARERRESFGTNEASDAEALSEMKKNIAREVESRGRSGGSELVSEVAVVTSAIEREATPSGEAGEEKKKTSAKAAAQRRSRTTQSADDDVSAPSTSVAATDVQDSADTPETPPKTDVATVPSTSPTPGNANHVRPTTPTPPLDADKTAAKDAPAEQNSDLPPDSAGDTDELQATGKPGHQNMVTRVKKPYLEGRPAAGSRRETPSSAVSKASSAASRPNAASGPGPHRARSVPHSEASKAAGAARSPPTCARSQVKRPDQRSIRPAASKTAKDKPQGGTPPRAAAARPPPPTSAGQAAHPRSRATTGSSKEQPRPTAGAASKKRASNLAPAAPLAAKPSGANGTASRRVSGVSAPGNVRRQPSTRHETKPAASKAAASKGAGKGRDVGRPAGASRSAQDVRSTKAVTKPVSEGFLARMMRPTAASANKASEKAPTPSPAPSKASLARTKSLSDRTKGPEHEQNGKPHDPKKQEPRVKAEPKDDAGEADHADGATGSAERSTLPDEPSLTGAGHEPEGHDAGTDGAEPIAT